MKKIILITLVLLSFSFQSKSDYIQSDISLLCSGKWYLEYMKVAGEKIPLPAKMIENSWVIYHSDGRADGMDQNGMQKKGKWEYLKDQKSIKTTNEGEEDIQKIISISKSKLVLSMNKYEHKYEIGFTKR